MKIKKIAGLVLVLGALIANSTNISYAAVYLQYGSQTKNSTIKTFSYSEPWNTIVTNGYSAWNGTSAGTNISLSSYSMNNVVVSGFQDTWYGLFSANSISGNFVTNYTVNVNSRTISQDAVNINNFGQSVVAHEFGHLFFLNDNPVDSGSGKNMSLMNHARDRETVIRPTGFDLLNVTNKYK